jgi:hypothetical protein
MSFPLIKPRSATDCGPCAPPERPMRLGRLLSARVALATDRCFLLHYCGNPYLRSPRFVAAFLTFALALSLWAFPPAITRADITTGLVGQWKFDESSGSTTAADSSGSGNTGTLTNMATSTAWVSGQIGNALEFDGTNDYVNAGSASNLDDLSVMTVSAWIYPHTLGEGNLGVAACEQ